MNVATGLDYDALQKLVGIDTNLSELNDLTEEERNVILQIVSEFSERGSSASLKKLWTDDYDEVPVDIDTFLEDPFYFGDAVGGTIYPYWRDMLREIFEPGAKFFEVIFSCSIGVGKSTIACVGIAYVLYKLLCLKNPQAYHGLTKSSVMTINFFNISKLLAQAVGFAKFQGMVLKSPWFLKHGTVTGRQHLQWLPGKNIQLAIGSKADHALGQDVFCVSGDTKIMTDKGLFQIKDLAEETSVRVLQYDINNKEKVMSNPCYITETKKVNELIMIELEDGSIFKCTSDHLILLSDGTYRKAGELTEDDDILVLD